MKKLLLIITIFLYSTKVYAVEERWSDELSNDSNYIISNAEIRYRWYKELIKYSDNYYIEGDNDKLYPYINYNDFILTEFTEWSDKRPLNKNHRKIETKPAERYRVLKPIRYIILDNNDSDFYINELEVFAKNDKIDVSIECKKCATFFEVESGDGYYRDNSYISNGGRLYIDLGKLYSIEQVKLVLYAYDRRMAEKYFTLYFSDAPEIVSENYAFKELVYTPSSMNPSHPDRHVIQADASYIFNMGWNDWVYGDSGFNATYYREIQYLCLYRYQDTKYRYYNIEHSYLDGFHSTVEDSSYTKDPEGAKIFYLYNDISEEVEKVEDIDNNVGQICVEPNFDEDTNESVPIIPVNDNLPPAVDKNIDCKTVTDNYSNINYQNISNLTKKVMSNEKISSLLLNNDQGKYKDDSISKYIINHAYRFAKVKVKSLILGFIILLLLIFVIWCFKHHNLSHQK